MLDRFWFVYKLYDTVASFFYELWVSWLNRNETYELYVLDPEE